MAFDWPDYLKLADELSKRTEEACLRTAISRSYYYIYHLAKQRLDENQFIIVRGEGTHRQIWEKFEVEADFRCKKLYDLAKILLDKRKRADYEVPYAKIESEFPIILELARKFAKDLADLDKRLPKNRGVKA